jgi:DNA-binding MarR family transcriptional regulator
VAGNDKLGDADYAALADFRHALRAFQAFSEIRVAEFGLTPQQHQALLTIRGGPQDGVTIGYIADRLILKPHSASGLVARLEGSGLIERRRSSTDRRQIILGLTPDGMRLLERLSIIHRDEILRLRPLLSTLLNTFV